MTTRRSFLGWLGLSAVAAPVVAKAAQELPDDGKQFGWVRLNGRTIGADHSHTVTPNDGSHTHNITPMFVNGDIYAFAVPQPHGHTPDIVLRHYQDGQWISVESKPWMYEHPGDWRPA